MGMVKLEKIGAVSIKRQDRDEALYLSYWSAISQKTITRKVDSASINTARKEAAKLDREIRGNKAPYGYREGRHTRGYGPRHPAQSI